MQGGSRDSIKALEDALASQESTLNAIASLISKLRVELGADVAAIEAGTRDIGVTPFDDPFPLLRVASSCFDRSPRPHAQRLVELVSQTASAKEVILGLEELLAETRDVEQDPDDGDAETVLCAVIAYVQAYQTCLRRLRSAKLDRFYSTALQTVSSTVTHLVIQGVLPTQEAPSDYRLDLDLVEAMFDLASSVHLVIENSQQRQAAESDARAMMETVIGLVGPAIPSDNANDFFLARFPRYQKSSHSVKASSERDLAAGRFWKTTFPRLYTSLGYQLDDLLVACRFAEPLKRIGSLSILSHYLATRPSTSISAFDFDEDSATPSLLLTATLDIVRRALQPQTAYRLAEDDILFFLWWCIDQQQKIGDGAKGLGEEVLYPLVEVLSSLSALSSNPQTRFLSFRLLATVVLEHTGTSTESEPIQLELLKDLITGNGTPAFRTACVGIAKEVMNSKLQELENDPKFQSLFLSTAFLDVFESILLRYDTRNLFDQKISPDTFVERYERDVSQKLNFYFFLLTRDRENKTGIRSWATLERSKLNLLDPLRAYLSEHLDLTSDESDSLAPTTTLELELVRTSLVRIDEALSTL